MTNDEHIDSELADNGDPRNVIDSYKTWRTEAVKDDLAKKAFPLHVAIENYQHDYNIGSIVRSANACNVAGVHIIGRRHWNRRGAMATEKYLKLYHHRTVKTFHEWTIKHKLRRIGIDNIEASQPLNSAELPKSTVYIFGQEGPGLSDEMQNICETVIAIEQFGSTRSVNVGVAAGIVLYTWLQRHVLQK